MLSTRVPAFPGIYGAMLLPDGKKGPTDEPYLCTSESQFLKVFTPNESVEVGYDLAYYSALAFLQKSDKLWVKRIIKDDATYGGVAIKKEGSATANAAWSSGETDPTAYTFDAEDSLVVYGKNAGEWNDDIYFTVHKYYAKEDISAVDETTEELTVAQDWTTGIEVVLATTNTLPDPLAVNTVYYVIRVDATTIKLATTAANATAGTAIDLTDQGTGTHSIYAYFDRVKEPDAFMISIYKSSNLNVPVETYTCSREVGKKDGFGRNIFVEDALDGSYYLDAMSNSSVAETVQVKEQLTPIALNGGGDGSAVTDSDMLLGIADIANTENIPVTVIMDGGWATAAYQKQGILTTCENRQDCVGILSTPYDKEASANYLNDIVDYRKTILNANSSYGALYTPHVKIYDKFNDRPLFVSPDGYAGAALSYTASNYEMWYPPKLM